MGPMMRIYTLCWGPEEALLQDYGEGTGVESGEDGSWDREPSDSGC